MSRWRHSICDDCWQKREGNAVPSCTVNIEGESDICCFCGKAHQSGIFVQEDPAKTICLGNHEEVHP